MCCPEAVYWNVNDVILCGKSWMACLFVVVGRLSPTKVLVKYKRQLDSF